MEVRGQHHGPATLSGGKNPLPGTRSGLDVLEKRKKFLSLLGNRSRDRQAHENKRTAQRVAMGSGKMIDGGNTAKSACCMSAQDGATNCVVGATLHVQYRAGVLVLL